REPGAAVSESPRETGSARDGPADGGQRSAPAAGAAVEPWHGDRRGHEATAQRLSTVARLAGCPAGHADPCTAHPAGNPVPFAGGRARGAAAPDRVGRQSEPSDRAGHRVAEASLHPPAPDRGPRRAGPYESLDLPPSLSGADGHESAAVPKMVAVA